MAHYSGIMQTESVAIKVTDCREDIRQYNHFETSHNTHIISNDTHKQNNKRIFSYSVLL